MFPIVLKNICTLPTPDGPDTTKGLLVNRSLS